MKRSMAATAVWLGLCAAAQAHTGVGETTDLVAGLAHPFSGFDHLLAMVAVGLWAAQLGGAAVWQVPLVFMSLLAVGAGFGAAGIGLPLIEPGIVGSVIVMGGLVACAARLPTVAGMVLVGVFALFHGHAHGVEMPVEASGLRYALGFLLATLALHAGGVGLGLLARHHGDRWLRVCGVLIAGSGIALGFAS